MAKQDVELAEADHADMLQANGHDEPVKGTQLNSQGGSIMPQHEKALHWLAHLASLVIIALALIFARHPPPSNTASTAPPPTTGSPHFFPPSPPPPSTGEGVDWVPPTADPAPEPEPESSGSPSHGDAHHSTAGNHHPHMYGYYSKKGDDVCSGHGTRLKEGSTSWCFCFDCWEGPQCERKTDPCRAIVKPGDPYVFEDYWEEHKQDFTSVSVDAGYKMGYTFSDDHYDTEIKDSILALHRVAKNIEIADDMQVVLGAGGTMMIPAAMFAHGLTIHKAGGKGKVWVKRPYYSGYKDPSSFMKTEYFEWAEAMPSPEEESSVIEFVTHPNNPSGELREPMFPGAKIVYDHAYLWPHYTPMSGPRVLGPNDIALFTTSKLTGHAGTRLGWALTRNPQLAQRMHMFIQGMMLSLPREVIYRGLVFLGHIHRSQGEIFRFGRNMIQYKWEKLKEIFSQSSNVQLQPTMESAAYCHFAGEVVEPTPAYAWVHCINADPNDCVDVNDDICGCTKLFHDSQIEVQSGTNYGATDQFSRLHLLQRMEDFELMAEKLVKFVATVG